MKFIIIFFASLIALTGTMSLMASGNAPLIIKPLCPPGYKPSTTGNKDICVEGDPWSLEFFRSVVPILVDGKRICTGSSMGDGLIITAAHCVIETLGTEVEVVSASRVTIANIEGKVFPLIMAPQVPKEMLLSCLPKCPDLAYDFALLRVSSAAAVDWIPSPVLTDISSDGELPITIAGYGVTTMPKNFSKNGLYIGAQHLMLTAKDQPLEWSYEIWKDNSSSFCSGDSGGPIFLGSPRKQGDKLALIGVISRFMSSEGTCFQAKATAVNFTQPGPRTILCTFLGDKHSFCRI